MNRRGFIGRLMGAIGLAVAAPALAKTAAPDLCEKPLEDMVISLSNAPPIAMRPTKCHFAKILEPGFKKVFEAEFKPFEGDYWSAVTFKAGEPK